MDSVREWASAVCCACMIGAMLSAFFPGGGGKRLFSTVISMMIMCVIFRPLLSFGDWALELKDYSFDVSRSGNTALENEIEKSAESIYSSYLRQNLCRVLDWNHIPYKSIEIFMDNSADGSIFIERVEVIVKDEDVDNSNRIKTLLRDYIGFEPTVTAQTRRGSE